MLKDASAACEVAHGFHEVILFHLGHSHDHHEEREQQGYHVTVCSQPKRSRWLLQVLLLLQLP